MNRCACLAAVTAVTFGVLAPRPARAGLNSCSVAATDVRFGSYVGSEVRSAGLITVVCNGAGANNKYIISLSTGLAGSYFPRAMGSGANRLPYNLFQNAGRSTIWGDGTGQSRVEVNTINFRTSGTTSQSTVVFGDIPAQTPPRPGRYADLIVVTIIF